MMMDVNSIENLGLARVLRRGSAEIIEQRDDALLIRDSVSGAYLFACDDSAAGTELLDRRIGRDCGLMMVSDLALGTAAFERYGFTEMIECYQVAYYGETPVCDSRISVRTADANDLTMLEENYKLISPEELEEAVRRRSVLLGYHGDELIGFIGEHLEGSMGMLYIFPEHRHRGFASELEKHMIRATMERGYIPFGQVEKDNQASLNLQKKLGMTVSEKLIVWMWRQP